MLNQSLIAKFSQELKIAPLNIVREYLEMEVLYYLSLSPLSENLIFYGGTALRLAHQSFRFSEDLDFLQIKSLKTDKKELENMLQKVVEENQGVKIEEIFDKRLTLFGLLHIKNELLKHPIRIKIEINKKGNGLETQNFLLSSLVTNKEVIFRTPTLESMYQLKIEAIKGRDVSRDWFDLWYLSQKLKKENPRVKKLPFSPPEFANELKRWLPRDKWKIIETVIYFYQKNEKEN